MKIVSYAVKGCQPVFTKQINAVAIDPVADGQAIANAAVALLQKKSIPRTIPLTLTYVRGETLTP